MIKSTRRCETCRFSNSEEVRDPGTRKLVDRLECRIRAASTWAYVNPTDWCGEWDIPAGVLETNIEVADTLVKAAKTAKNSGIVRFSDYMKPGAGRKLEPGEKIEVFES